MNIKKEELLENIKKMYLNELIELSKYSITIPEKNINLNMTCHLVSNAIKF